MDAAGDDEKARSAEVSAVRRVTVAGAAVNVAIAGIKFAGGIAFSSQALLADAAHSLSDLITDVALVLGVKFWVSPADDDHPYGHGQIEALVTAFIGLMVAGVAIEICRKGVCALVSGNASVPDAMAFVVALVSVVAKEGLYRWTHAVAMRFGSQATEANAWHHRSDAISSVPVACAVAIAHFVPELKWLDAAGAVLVGGFILRVAWQISKPALLDLTDAQSGSKAAEVERVALAVSGVRSVHHVRTRRYGGAFQADLHVQVSRDISISDGHAIGHEVKSAIIAADIGVTDAIIHVEPEDARVVLCLGSNIEPRRRYLDRAQAALCALPSSHFVAASETEETEPAGVPPEFASMKFLNRILVLNTALSPKDFSDRMHRIETDLGRGRSSVRNAPRTIDIDMIDYEGVVSDDPELTLPHPRAKERAFVMEPLRKLGISLQSAAAPKRERYHFAGIGGVGMAGVAFLLKKAGHDVSGCDLHPSPRTRWLEANGIPVAVGHSASHVVQDLDTCVFTPAVPKGNPEFAAAKAAGCRVLYRGEVLAEMFNRSNGIAVCGTHGKTTTATFIAKLLRALGDDPSWCIGGETGDMPVAGVGGGPFVVEADESDGTLALYRARILAVTSLDYDHPDHFKTHEDYLACYRKAMDAADTIIESRKLPLDDWPEIRPLVLGEHNVRNARTAVEVALRLGHAREAILAALPDAVSTLPDRRFERICENVHTDYAHHPAEIACAISMARTLKPKRLRVIFQPHRYSRTKALLDEFTSAFEGVDELVLVPVYPAFEDPIPGGDIADLYLALRESPSPVPRLLLARNAEEAWRHVRITCEEGDEVIILGAGDLINLVPRIKRDMSAPRPKRSLRDLSELSFFRTGGASCGGGEPAIVGMGSNIWFSDCATDIEIVKAPPGSQASQPGVSLIATHPELAFMAGIPGTIGGWARMNAGAFGDSFGNHIESVVADGRRIPAAECGFGYRTSSIRGLITEVALRPPEASAATQTAADYLARRRRFPPRTCGSVFKNPSPDAPAGRLLEEAGAKSLRVGGAYVWSEHANVIVAGDGCTSSDILALARLMAARVRARFAIDLVPEIRGLEV